MKPFDLKAAKAGAPVCTRDGRKARIICFDKEPKQFPIVALITHYNPNTGEHVKVYTEEGRLEVYKKGDNDLMMATQGREGWINVYPSFCSFPQAGRSIYSTKEEADTYASEGRLTVAKVSWEE